MSQAPFPPRPPAPHLPDPGPVVAYAGTSLPSAAWSVANKVAAALLLVFCLITGFAISAALLRYLRL